MIQLYLENEKHNVKELMESSSIRLQHDNDFDVFIFRRLLEAALKMGFWNGSVGMS